MGICNTCGSTEMLCSGRCYINSPPYRKRTCCATHITCASCGDREQRTLNSQTSPYTISPFQSFINKRQQAGTLLFSLHHAIPPAWNSLIVFSLNPTAQFSPFPYIYVCRCLPSASSLIPYFTLILQYLQPFLFLCCSIIVAGPSKRREEEIAKEAEYEEANNPVDWVDVDDDHVHIKAPASRVILKVHGIQTVASSMGELASSNGTGLPLEAWFGWQMRHLIQWFLLMWHSTQNLCKLAVKYFHSSLNSCQLHWILMVTSFHCGKKASKCHKCGYNWGRQGPL